MVSFYKALFEQVGTCSVSSEILNVNTAALTSTQAHSCLSVYRQPLLQELYDSLHTFPLPILFSQPACKVGYFQLELSGTVENSKSPAIP